MDWVDFVIILIICFFIWRGYKGGLIAILVDFAGILISFLVALRYSYAGINFIREYIAVPTAYDNPLGFISIFLAVEVAYFFVSPIISKLMPSAIKNSSVNKLGGAFVSAGKGIIIVCVLLIIAKLLPLPSKLTHDINNSVISKFAYKEINNINKSIGSSLEYPYLQF